MEADKFFELLGYRLSEFQIDNEDFMFKYVKPGESITITKGKAKKHIDKGVLFWSYKERFAALTKLIEMNGVPKENKQ